MAQSGTPGPDELWTHEPSGGASVNDVAIDGTGGIPVAVQGDANPTPTADDDEVFAWNLDKNKNSQTPVLRDDPSPGLGQPEGLGVVAIETASNGQGDFFAVGREGSSDGGHDNIYVYRRTTGGESESKVTYSGDSSAPGALEGLWFLDRETLLAYHVDALSLLERDRGTQYEEGSEGRWTPPSGETIRAVDVTTDEDRVAVLTSKDPDGVGNVTIKLRVLEVDNGQLESITVPWNKARENPGGEVAISQDGRFVLVGADGKALFYFQLHDNDEGDSDAPDNRFSEFPWTSKGPSGVSQVAISPNGALLAAGFDNGALSVFERTATTEDGPRAERAIDAPVDTGSAPSQIRFADGDRSLFVQASGLMAFHKRQFDGESPNPLWVLPGVTAFDVGEDAQRIVTAQPGDSGSSVSAYEQSFSAKTKLEVPDTVTPGRGADVQATITNTGSAFDAYKLKVTGLPNGWSVETSDNATELLPSETENVTFQLVPSSTHAPGEQSFTVKVVSQLGPDNPTVAKAETSTNVETVHAAGLEVDTSQRSISQGGSLTIEPTVANAGNTEEAITLEVRQDEEWEITVDGQPDEASATLAPGEETTNLTVQVTAPEAVEKGLTNTLELAASPESGRSLARASIPVIVDPSYDATIEVPAEPVAGEAGGAVRSQINLTNAGNTEDTFTLEVESNASNPQQLWSAGLDTQKVTLDDDETQAVTVTVNVPRNAQEGESTTVTLRATSSNTGERVAEASYQVAIPEETQDSPIGPWLVLAAVSLAAATARRRQG